MCDFGSEGRHVTGYVDTRDETGTLTTVITDPTGEVVEYTESEGKLEVNLRPVYNMCKTYSEF